MAIDPISFQEHDSRDPDRTVAFDQGKSLRDSSTKFSQASRVLAARGLRFSKNDYYNLARSEGSHDTRRRVELCFSIVG